MCRLEFHVTWLMYLLMSSSTLLAQSSVGIPGVLPPDSRPELVKEGFVFTEGPIGAADGSLYFSDVRASRIYHLELSGAINVFRDNTSGANGIAFDSNGQIYVAEGDGKRISRLSGGELQPVV